MLHLLVAAAGLALVIWGIVGLTNPLITCHNQVMHPGDTCTVSSFTQENSSTVQTYEQRRANARMSQPAVIGIGLLAGGFGVALYLQDRKRARRAPRP